MRTFRHAIPRVYAPLLQPSRYKGAWGGRGSTKSHTFAELLIKRCLEKPTRAVCVREIQRSLEQSVKRLLEDKITTYDLGSYFRVMNTHIETPGEGIIIFNGMQNHTAESIKSLEGYDIAWVEEAQSLSERSLTLLRPTIRQPGSELWFSWNPRFPTDPVDKLLRGKDTPPDAIVVGSTYKDNPWFPDVLRAEMEWDRRTDLDKYNHVWLGGYEEHSEARVFKNWRVEDFETPTPQPFFLFGGDWGYSIDPTVLVRAYEVRPPAPARKQLFIDAEAYKVGCEIDDIPDLFDKVGCQEDITPFIEAEIKARKPETFHRLYQQGYGMARRYPIIADSARPETISYLRRNGYPLIGPSKKGAGSVKDGVIFLQGYDIIIHPRCKHTIDEFTAYSYKKDPITNVVSAELEDKKNHVIDSVRYAVETLRGVRETVHEAVWG